MNNILGNFLPLSFKDKTKGMFKSKA